MVFARYGEVKAEFTAEGAEIETEGRVGRAGRFREGVSASGPLSAERSTRKPN